MEDGDVGNDDIATELCNVMLRTVNDCGHDALIPMSFLRKPLGCINKGAVSPVVWIQPFSSRTIGIVLIACPPSEEIETSGELCSFVGLARSKENVYSVLALIVFEFPTVITKVPGALVHTAVDSTSVAKALPTRGKFLVSWVPLPVKPMIVIEETIPPAEPIAMFAWRDTVILFLVSPG